MLTRGALSFLFAVCVLFAGPGRAESVTTVRDFIEQSVAGASAREFEVRGAVTAFWGRDAFFLQDETGGVFVYRTGAAGELRVQDRVEVRGTAAYGGATPHLRSSAVKATGRGARVEPLDLAPNRPPGPDADARLVRVRGRLAGAHGHVPNGNELPLAVFGATVPAVFEGLDDGSAWPAFPPGALVEATGVLSVRGPDDKSPYPYKLVLRSRRDVTFVAPPPWWMPPRLYTLLGVTGVLITAALVAVGLLRHRVQRQTAQLHTQLESEAAMARRHRELFEGATDVILSHDLDGRITDFNPAGERLLGWSAKDLQGRAIESLMAPSSADIAGGLVKPGGETQPRGASFRLDLMASDGRAVPFEVNSWIEVHDGEPVGVVAICRDISGRLRAEQEAAELDRKFQQTQKLESLGILAGGVAHDFNNLLTSILGNASLARMDLPANAAAQKSLEEIETAAERAAELCRQMLAYAGQGRFISSRVNLNTLISETVDLLQSSVSKRATIELHLAEQLPAVQGDATQMRQIIMNLVLNAGESLGEGSGLIAVKTGTMTADPAWLRDAQIAPETWEGEYVSLEVADNGSGMTPETLARIFEPFFTTKFTGRGLGLAAVLGIVRGHRGALHVTSDLGQGTTFRLAFPAVGMPAATTSATAGRGPAPVIDGTVLVVDDEETVRRTVARALERVGCKVLTAEDGALALEKVRRATKPIDLVLLDLTMPVMDGVQTLRELRRLCPDLPVMLMSGFAEVQAVARFGEHRLAGFLQKPFTVDLLQRRVAEALRTSAEPALFP
jgi:PAS domain S-box-containing protein